jgi:phosphoglycerate dehydrogenase-like enzyme
MNILLNGPPAFHACARFAPSIERLRTLGSLHQTSHNTPQEIAADLRWADALLMWSWPVIDGAMLDAEGGLRLLGHLDVSRIAAEAALAREIPLSLVKRAWSPAVAELALGSIINGLRRLSAQHIQMRQAGERWGGLWPAAVDPRERSLEELRVGIVGFGGVGQQLRRLLSPHGCAVAVVDPYVPQAVLDEHLVQRVDLAEMIASCDVVVLCAAANAGTRALFGAAEIEALRSDAVLVNVARAGLVDTAALVERLRRDDLTAFIDVFDQEPLSPEHPLRPLPNAFLTPHRAGGILASGNRILAMLSADLEAAWNGRPISHGLRREALVSLDG